MATSKKKPTTVTVNLADAVGGNVPEGAYLVSVQEVTKEESNSGNDYLAWKFSVADGKHKGKVLYDNTSLQPQALWRLRATLEALGYEIEEGDMDLDLSSFTGDQAVAVVAHEEYENKKRARIVDLFSVESDEAKEALGMEEEEEKPAAKKTGAKKPAATEEEEEEEKKPAAKKSGSKKKEEPEKLKEDDVMSLDEDDLASLIEEHSLEVDLEDHATLRKKRNAVVAALEEADLLEAAE